MVWRPHEWVDLYSFGFNYAKDPIQSIEKNKEAWTELAENLDEQYRSIQIYIKQIDDKRSIDNGLRTILLAYVA
jgi:hypothetical protein